MTSLRVAAGNICRMAFYVSVALFFYGTLFPFDFDLSRIAWSQDWPSISLIPYWDVDRGRIHSVPDMVSNILLTIPFGFFGFLWVEKAQTWARVLKWGLWGLALGLTVEVIQLTLPSRVPSLTDMLNNAAGALGGAALAQLLGLRVLTFLSEARRDRDETTAWLLFLVLIAVTLGPFDLTLSVSHVRAGLKALLTDPWEAQRAIGHEWVQMVDFALFASCAAQVMHRRRTPSGPPPRLAVVALLGLPFALEVAQLFVLSHAPSLRDMAMGCLGVSAGLLGRRYWPGLVRPATGLMLLTAALIAAGLSPYRFVPWALRADFLWIPLGEYYSHTTMQAVYDAGIGIVHFGVFAALASASLDRSRWTSTLLAAALAAGIEGAQMIVPERTAGITDVLIAALGGWVGSTIWAALKRQPSPPGIGDQRRRAGRAGVKPPGSLTPQPVEETS
jgi:VanZ family protein